MYRESYFAFKYTFTTKYCGPNLGTKRTWFFSFSFRTLYSHLRFCTRTWFFSFIFRRLYSHLRFCTTSFIGEVPYDPHIRYLCIVSTESLSTSRGRHCVDWEISPGHSTGSHCLDGEILVPWSSINLPSSYLDRAVLRLDASHKAFPTLISNTCKCWMLMYVVICHRGTLRSHGFSTRHIFIQWTFSSSSSYSAGCLRKR
jgi:hypothetical protein